MLSSSSIACLSASLGEKGLFRAAKQYSSNSRCCPSICLLAVPAIFQPKVSSLTTKTVSQPPAQVFLVNCSVFRGRSRIFFRRGCTPLLLYFNTNKPHSFFFLQNTSCIRKLQVISGGGGGAHPLHPPPRSAPGFLAVMLPNRHHCHILQNSSKFGQQLLIMMNDVCDISQSEMEK